MKSIEKLDLVGKRVFIRADLNVPFAEDGSIADDHRIRATLPTLNIALEKGARVILASHAGRPKGQVVASLSLKPVAARLEQLLSCKVIMAPDCIGDQVEALVETLNPGQVLLLENLRFHKEESANDPVFSRALAAFADVYINDAFATAHRAHASTVGMVAHVPVHAAGVNLKRELDYFEQAFLNPEKPLVAIFGGAKVSTKLAAIENVAGKAQYVLIGGAMANTFFAATGKNVGKSLYEPDLLDKASKIGPLLAAQNCKLVLPTDVVVAAEMKGGLPTRTVSIDHIGAEDRALDIGANSIKQFQAVITQASTIIWNGPMGAFEFKEFSTGTFAIVDALAASSALTVVGGGDTDLALHQRHAFDKMSYVSTGGGAFLELLEGKTLPAVAALT